MLFIAFSLDRRVVQVREWNNVAHFAGGCLETVFSALSESNSLFLAWILAGWDLRNVSEFARKYFIRNVLLRVKGRRVVFCRSDNPSLLWVYLRDSINDSRLYA